MASNRHHEPSTVWLVRHGEIGDVLDAVSVRESSKSAAACARQFVPNEVNRLENYREDGGLTITWDGHSKIVTTTKVDYEQ